MQKMRKSGWDRAFNAVNALIMVLVLVVTLYPFWYVLVGSVSSIGHLVKNGFVLWPDGLHWDAYEQVFRNNLIPTAYRNTIIVTLGGTALSMVLSIMGAYALSLKKLPGRKGITMFFVFTMLFSGGLVPTYLVVSELGLIDSLWALILPGCVSTYNMVLLRNFFQSVPEDLYEAASIDGETMLGYMVKILLPLSGAAIATVTLFYAVGYWNDYFKSLIYIRNNQLWPMQTVLRQVLQTSAVQHHDVRRRGAARCGRNAEGRHDRRVGAADSVRVSVRAALFRQGRHGWLAEGLTGMRNFTRLAV